MLEGQEDPVGIPLWRLHSDAVVEGLLQRWVPGNLGAVLKTDLYDEVAGPGIAGPLRRRAERVVGIDISLEFVAAAAKRNEGLETVVTDVRATPFEPESFAAVLSNSTLDHLPNEAEVSGALAEIARVLAPGGRLVVTLDNPLNPLIAVRNAMPVRLSRPLRQGFEYEPGWTCGPRRLRELLAGAGLEVEDQTAAMHAPRVAVARMGRRPPEEAEASLRRLMSWERMGAWPSRYVTGHFVAALATKPTSART